MTFVVGIDEPASDVVGGGATNLAGGWIVHIHALDLHRQPAALCLFDVHVRLSEYHEEISRFGLFQKFVGHLPELGLITPGGSCNVRRLRVVPSLMDVLYSCGRIGGSA